MQIDFIFELDQKVITPFQEGGIITMLGVDGNGIMYYVKTKVTAEWHKEKELTSIEKFRDLTQKI